VNMVVGVKVPRGTANNFTRERILHEMRVWSSVNHPNIVPLLGVSFNFDRPNTPCLISPYYHHGDIITYLTGNQHIDMLPLIVQIATAISYLHRRSIVHGDIKGSNVLIDDNGNALVTDFGRSRILDVCKSTSAEELTPDSVHGLIPLSPEGDPSEMATYEWRWMAPELLDVYEDDIPLVTVATDIYSFAMTTIQIISQRIPFWYILVDASVVVYVVSGGRPKRAAYQQINDDIWSMLEESWSTEPSRRPSMDAIVCFFSKQLTSLNPERAHL